MEPKAEMPEKPITVFAVIHTDTHGKKQISYYASKRRANQAAKELPGSTRIVGVKL